MSEAPALRYFFCRLIPPRPDFARTMSPEERALMREHGAHWMKHMEAGRVIVFGPVADSAGDWGLGVVRGPDIGAIESLRNGDPVMRVPGFRYEISPMHAAVTPI
ncbi:MAG TPA: YciI family protein [Bauldia sp.]|nr:YciI family protein [Bauldia sp.]